MSEPARHPTPLLPVGVRTVLGPEGEVAHSAAVHCFRRERSIEVDECLRCPHCKGMVSDDEGSYVRCHERSAVAALERTGEAGPRPSAADSTPLSIAMSPNVVCVRPDLRIEALEYLLLQLGISGVPVVDEAGRPIGVVSKSDLLRQLHIDPECDCTVADIMMPMSFSLPESASLSQAAALMAYEGIHRVPVVSSGGVVVGIVSTMDVARWLARHDGYLVPGGSARVEGEVAARGSMFDTEE